MTERTMGRKLPYSSRKQKLKKAKTTGKRICEDKKAPPGGLQAIRA